MYQSAILVILGPSFIAGYATVGSNSGAHMESSIRKNRIVAVCVAVIAVLAGVLVVNIVSDIRSQLLLKQTYSELKWIALALHSYHDAHGSFPPVVIRDGQGNPIHSWRAIIHGEMAKAVESAEFKSYNFSQAWDSQANRQSTSGRFRSYRYQALAVVGPQAAWKIDGTRSLSDFKDGAAKTILLIAVRNTGTAWHQPVDAVVSESGNLTVNNRELDHSKDLFIVTADGSITYAAKGIAPHTMSALLTINAGDAVAEW